MRKFSHAHLTKVIVFMIMIAFFTGTVISFVKIVTVPYNSMLQKSYFQSAAYIEESHPLIHGLTLLMTEYQSEEHVKAGGTIDQDEWNQAEEELFLRYLNSVTYHPQMDHEQNYNRFKEEYAEEIAAARNDLIQKERREYHRLLQWLEDTEAPLFYATDGTHVYTNTTLTYRHQFEAHPAYLIFEHYNQEFYPIEMTDNAYLSWITDTTNELNPENTIIYVAFTEAFLAPKLEEWEANSELAAANLYRLTFFIPGFIFSFFYLALVIGRKSFSDTQIRFHFLDKLYNDLNMILCILLIMLFVWLLDLFFEILNDMLLPMTVPIAVIGFLLILSLIKHGKNKSFFQHTLMYQLIHKAVSYIGDVYRSGHVGVKTALIVIGYPVLIAITFFMFPVTMGVAAWFAHRKVKSFQAIRNGIGEISSGNLHYHMDVKGKGEFAKLAEQMNRITDGLKNAVARELKSERLKTELITNVSHDIRTPLTSIITYVDLLKKEEVSTKAKDYIQVLDQKSKRLKALTDDLFDAAKASSGDIPIQLETIDVVSLISQGLGEVDEQITEKRLELKFYHPPGKVCVTADGRLLWRSIENLLSNIFNYALEGSRVYVTIEELENDVRLTFKNISANELNMTAEELMERFKRGDESRTTEGSGLGISIAKSLIELQKGSFTIQIDGDLFKAIIVLPRLRGGAEVRYEKTIR